MRIAHIVAAAENDIIARDGELPWHIPEDLKWFHDKTRGCALVMGRKTFESLGHPLPDRLNVVVTRQPGYEAPGGLVVPTIDEGVRECWAQNAKYGNEIFIIGGGEIYAQSMDLVDVIYLTRIHDSFEGDVRYPKVDPNIFVEVDRVDREEPLPFSIITYVRRKEHPPRRITV